MKMPMFKYLLLGFVLMLSGLQVTAQVAYLCTDREADYYQFTDDHNAATDFTIVPQNQDATEQFTPASDTVIAVPVDTEGVLVWENATYDTQVWQSPETIACLSAVQQAETENAMLTYIHHARERWSGVFGRGGK
jgi:hypothetical protein